MYLDEYLTVNEFKIENKEEAYIEQKNQSSLLKLSGVSLQLLKNYTTQKNILLIVKIN